MDVNAAAWDRVFEQWEIRHPGWTVRTHGPALVESLTPEGEPDGFLVEVVHADTGGHIQGIGDGPEEALAEASRQVRGVSR